MSRHRYHLAIFDEPWKDGDPDRRKTGDPKAGGGRRKGPEPKAPEQPRLRDPKTGEFVSVAEFERILKERTDKEHELNQENAKRRNENKELREKLDTVVSAHESMKQLALRTQAVAALTTAKAIDPDVVTDAFLRWAADKVKVGANLAVEGLTPELVGEFVKAKPKLFESADGGTGTGTQRTIGLEDTKPNATSAGLSPGGGSASGAQTPKLDFKGVDKEADPGKALDDIIAAYARSV